MAAALVATGGCANMESTFFDTAEPTLVTVTPQNLALRNLPAPNRRMNIAVYDFPDLTGQYKERDAVQSLSRAVTQGGSAMLIKALQDAGERRWFTVLDRSGLQDLVRERQIVTEMRRQYRNEAQVNPSALKPLLHAGILLQGGIVGYDTNVQTGGAGARYLGIGMDGRWILDTVTVSLRAVSTETGEVLASVMSQKSVASSSIRGSVFRYVMLNELLEMEAGVTANEPKQIAVQQAIEKAVYSLVIEGAELGVWSFKDKSAGASLIGRYRGEKYGANLPETARFIVPPKTRGAADITQTVPYSRPAPRASVRQLPPTQSQPDVPKPPAAGDNEVVG
ncbi:CsgG/HfaB family protein [Oceanicola sp. 22II-s10i]|uniref:CsgG/HfaB family protein n=1 Tax=Oceanicola sp. 22II-s10i TaxID=1317116 RepID=UPI00159601D8|nr:CsgG/HfaB family protein [Oceanicola sp. 22II-s10i]